MLYNIEASANFLTKDHILSKVSEYDIFTHYIGKNVELGSVIRSPLRYDDFNPSFGIYRAKNGRLLFKDMARPDLCGDCFKFVKLLLNKNNYKDVMIDIYINMILSNTKRNPSKLVDKPKKNIAINRTAFTPQDLEWWSKFNITEEILKKFKVSKARLVYVNDILVNKSTKDKPLYAYRIFNSFQIYSPLETNKKYKWLSDRSLYDIFGYEQLPETGDILVISKAGKDVMFLYSIGIPAIAPSAESTSIPQSVIDILKKRFKKIIIFYDNDTTGITSADKLNKKYNIPYTYIPDSYEVKDITDYCKEYSIESAKELMYTLINETSEKIAC